MNINDEVYYKGEYTNCHNYVYKITDIYKNHYGVITHCDIVSINPNPLTHYTEILSVRINDLSYGNVCI